MSSDSGAGWFVVRDVSLRGGALGDPFDAACGWSPNRSPDESVLARVTVPSDLGPIKKKEVFGVHAQSEVFESQNSCKVLYQCPEKRHSCV